MESRGEHDARQPVFHIGAPPAGYQPPPRRRRAVPLWATVGIALLAFLIGLGSGAAGRKTQDTAASGTPTTAATTPPAAAPPAVTTVYVTTQAPAAAASRAPAAAAPTTAAKPAPATTPKPAPVTIPGEGTFAVGTDIKPGIYKSSGPTPDSLLPDCYWERDKDLSGGMDSIIANNNSKGPTTVQIYATDKAFKTSGCADWTKVG